MSRILLLKRRTLAEAGRKLGTGFGEEMPEKSICDPQGTIWSPVRYSVLSSEAHWYISEVKGKVQGWQVLLYIRNVGFSQS